MIADVSGKGIAAAMFMAVTLMLIRQYAKIGLSPAEILQRTNDTLSENNAELLFATAFLGIYDSTEKSFTYANAGHNLPYLIGKTPRARQREIRVSCCLTSTYTRWSGLKKQSSLCRSNVRCC